MRDMNCRGVPERLRLLPAETLRLKQPKHAPRLAMEKESSASDYSSSEDDESFDVEQEIRRELEALGPSDDPLDEDETFDEEGLKPVSQVAWNEEDNNLNADYNSSDRIESLSSFQDLISVLSSRDKELEAFRRELEDDPSECSEIFSTGSCRDDSASALEAPLMMEETLPFDQEIKSIHQSLRNLRLQQDNGKMTAKTETDNMSENAQEMTQHISEREREIEENHRRELEKMEQSLEERRKKHVANLEALTNAKKVEENALSVLQVEARLVDLARQEQINAPIDSTFSHLGREDSDSIASQLSVAIEQRRAYEQKYHQLTKEATEVESEHRKLVRHEDEQRKIDLFSIRKAAATHEVRGVKQQIFTCREKLQKLVHFFEVNAKVSLEFERNRSAALQERAKRLMTFHAQANTTLNNRLTEIDSISTSSKHSADRYRKETTKLKAKLIILEKERATAWAEKDFQQTSLAAKIKYREENLHRKVQNENLQKRKELQLITNAARGENLETVAALDFRDACIEQLPNLEPVSDTVISLNLAGNQIGSLSGVAKLPHLRELNVSGNLLDRMDLALLYQLSSLRAASNNLKLIELSNELRYVDLSHNPLRDITFLESSAKTLQFIILSDTHVKDISYLEVINRLLYLDISNNGYSKEGVDCLTDCEVLQYVSLAGNEFFQMPDIGNLLLMEADLSSNKFRQLHVQSWLPMLSHLNVSNNRIDDIVPLALCPFLNNLTLSDNCLMDMSTIYAIAVCTTLESIWLPRNPIVHDRRLSTVLAVALPSLRTLDDQPFQPPFVSSKERMRILQEIIDLFESHIPRTHQALESFELYRTYKQLVSFQKEKIKTLLGSYRPPFLSYIYPDLCGEGVDTSLPVKDRLQIQETKLDELTFMLQRFKNEHQTLNKVPITSGFILTCRIKELEIEKSKQAAIQIQSVVRMRICQLRLFRKKIAARQIQIGWHTYKVNEAKRALERKVRKQNRMATKIQAVFRGWVTKRKLQKIREKAFHARRQAELEDQEMRALTVDEWPEMSGFEEKLQEYLSQEHLIPIEAEPPPLPSPQPEPKPVEQPTVLQPVVKTRVKREPKVAVQVASKPKKAKRKEIKTEQAPIEKKTKNKGRKRRPHKSKDKRTQEEDDEEMEDEDDETDEGDDEEEDEEEESGEEEEERIHEVIRPEKVRETKNDNEDGIIAARQEDWHFHDARTKQLLAKKSMRFAAMERKALRRESMKDPYQRLKVFQRYNATRNAKYAIDEWDRSEKRSVVDTTTPHTTEQQEMYRWNINPPLGQVPAENVSVSTSRVRNHGRTSPTLFRCTDSPPVRQSLQPHANTHVRSNTISSEKLDDSPLPPELIKARFLTPLEKERNRDHGGSLPHPNVTSYGGLATPESLRLSEKSSLPPVIKSPSRQEQHSSAEILARQTSLLNLNMLEKLYLPRKAQPYVQGPDVLRTPSPQPQLPPLSVHTSPSHPKRPISLPLISNTPPQLN